MTAEIINLAFRRNPASREVGSSGSITVREDDDLYIISTDLPGVATDDVRIALSGGVLTVTATLEHEASGDVGPVFAINYRCASIEQSFALPDDVDPEAVSAVFDDTVLRIRIGRRSDALQ